jgi:hypothetical protein
MGEKKRRPISLSLRFSVYERDDRTCQYCGRSAPEVELQVDHVHPVSLGGTNRIDNLLTACRDCNIGKGARDPGLSMPRRPNTILESAFEAREDARYWANAAFLFAAPEVRGLMWEIAANADADGVELVLPWNDAARVETERLLRGLASVGAIRITSRHPTVVYLLIEENRGREDDPAPRWSLGASGPVSYAPSVAEIYG